MSRALFARARGAFAEQTRPEQHSLDHRSPRRLRPLRTGLAFLSAAAIAGVGLSAPLGGGLSPAHADSGTVFTVTDGSDTSGSAPQPRSLRDALQQISAASTQGGAPPTDYTVAFDPSVSLVTLTGDLEVELGSGAQSLTIEGDATIDLSDNDVDFTGVGLSGAMTVSGLTITGDSTWSNPVAQSTTLTGVTRTGYGETLFQSRESDTLSNVIATNSTFTLEAPEDVSDTYALTVSGDSLDSSRFTDAPFTVHAGASGRNDLTVRNTRMTGNEQQTAFGVYTYAAEAGAPVHLAIEGSEITDNPSGGVLTTSAETVTVTDTLFQSNGRAGALNLNMEGGTASWVHVANSTFRQNLGDFAGLTVKDTVGSVLVTGSEFSENDSAVAGTGEGGGVFILARNASEDEDPSGSAELPAGMVQGAIVIQENTFANNASMSGAAGVHVESFLSGGIEPTLLVERNQFEGNRSTFDANDVSVSMSGMDEEDRATIALRGNSFLGSAGGPSDPDNDSGRRSVSVMSAENTSIDVLNNTFSAAPGEDALLSIGTLATGSDLALTHNTFSGGGVAIGSLQEVGGDALRVHATVFDTAHDPLSIDEGAQPAVLGDVQTVTASPNLPGAAPATSEGLALAEPGNNGGPTLTMLPAEGSTLIDAVTADASYAAADQRGVPRPQGPAADIGAVEIEEPLDDDVITLDQDLTVVEGEDAVITALRTGPSLSEGSATLTAQDGTALLDTDYSRATGTVTFPAQDTRAPEPQRATLTIPTVKRSGPQGERSFTVTLTEPSEGAVLGEPVTVTVTITDAEDTDGDADAAADAAADGGTDVASDGGIDGDGGSDVDSPGTDAPDADASDADGASQPTPRPTTTGLSETGTAGQGTLIWGGIAVLAVGAGLLLWRRLRTRRATRADAPEHPADDA